MNPFDITGSYQVYSPQAIVAAGHYQRAVSVKMDLKPNAHDELRRKINIHYIYTRLSNAIYTKKRLCIYISIYLSTSCLQKTSSPKRILTAETGSECAGKVFRHFPVLTSHIRTLSSNLQVKTGSVTFTHNRHCKVVTG